jgi:TPR repeat protein
LIREAKYYRIPAELNEPSAENSFGICFERGIGVHSNLILAVRYYKRAVENSDLDGVNNLKFCLEHSFGAKQEFAAVAECYKSDRDHGHSEADLNYRCGLRILGHWDVPDQSSRIVDSRSLDDHLVHLFIVCLKEPNINPELIASIQGLKATMPNGPRLTSERIGGKFSSSSIMKLEADSNGCLMMVQTSPDSLITERILHDLAFLKK